MATTRGNVRVGGSAFTQFQWNGQVIGWARGVRDTGPRPIADPVPIQPMDARYPLDIITPAAQTAGQLEIRVFERFGSRVWDDLMVALSSAGIDPGPYNDITQVFIAMAALDTPINAIKIINPPRMNGTQVKPYGDVYLNCKITDIGDTEDIEIGSMDQVKNITITYTRKVRTDSTVFSKSGIQGINGSQLTDVTTSALPITF